MCTFQLHRSLCPISNDSCVKELWQQQRQQHWSAAAVKVATLLTLQLVNRDIKRTSSSYGVRRPLSEPCHRRLYRVSIHGPMVSKSGFKNEARY